MMKMSRLALTLGVLALCAGCLPTGPTTTSGDYERHKSNRDAYMYQGGP